RPETVPAGRPYEPPAVHLHRGAEVEAKGRAEQGFKVRRVSRLGQEREDPAAVVVDDDDGSVQAVQLCGQKAVEIVVEGKIPEDQDYGDAGRSRRAQRRRNDAVHAARTPVA